MAKERTGGGVDAPRRKRLEALRDDCRRHDQCAVAIGFVEVERSPIPEAAQLFGTPFPERWCTRALQDGRSIEMSLWGAEERAEKNAAAYLARLGRELAEMRVPSVRDFPALEDLAMFELATRAPSLRSWVATTMPPQFPPMPRADERLDEPDTKRRIEAAWKAAGFIEKIERKVPDVRAAIAELCDELLEVKPSASAPKRKRVNPGALWHDAVKALQLAREAGADPSDQAIADACGVSKSSFSRHVGQKPEWTELRAGRLGTAKRQATRDPSSWEDR